MVSDQAAYHTGVHILFCTATGIGPSTYLPDRKTMLWQLKAEGSQTQAS